MNGWSKKTSATSVCLCRKLPSDPDLRPTIRSPQHHMTSCHVKPGHAPASQHITTFVSPFCRISKRFLPLQVSFEKVSHEMRFESWARNVHLAFLEVFAGILSFHVFFFDLSCNLLGKSCFFSSDTESWMVKRGQIFWSYGPLPDVSPCPFATQAMLGIYWRLLSMKRDVAGVHQGFADQLLQLIEMNPAVWRHGF